MQQLLSSWSVFNKLYIIIHLLVNLVRFGDKLIVTQPLRSWSWWNQHFTDPEIILWALYFKKRSKQTSEQLLNKCSLNTQTYSIHLHFFILVVTSVYASEWSLLRFCMNNLHCYPFCTTITFEQNITYI